jgi:hypothetical protein
MNDALMGWDRPSLKTKPSFKPGSPSPQEYVSTNIDRTNGNTPALGSTKDTTPSANGSAIGGILVTQCAIRPCACTGRNSCANADRRALGEL